LRIQQICDFFIIHKVQYDWGAKMAVYTEIYGNELIAFCAAYDLGEVVSFTDIAEGIENSNYLLTLTSGLYILTLYEKRIQSADLPFS
jgi:homoserine kinase type II